MKKSPLTQVQNDKELLSWIKKHLKYHGVIKDYLFTPEEVIEKGLAHCWESTELERRELHYLGYKCNTIMLTTDNASVTHTALVYIKDKKYYWFEWAWYKHEGIHGPFDTRHDVIKYITNLFIKDNGNKIHCFYGYMHINKNETAEEYFKRAEQCEEIKINYLNESDQIRLATIDDVDIIKEYRTNVSKETTWMNNPSKEKIKESIERYANDETRFYYLAIESNELVGIFTYHIDMVKGIFHIEHISVCKEKYGTGFAKQLMDLGEREAKKNKLNTLELIVHKDNIRGIKFYEKIGYKFIKASNHVLTYRKSLVKQKKFSLENW